MKTILERLKNGIITENPTFVLMLGMCPTLAVTTSAINGIGMGLATTVVLVMSNMLISILRKVIPNGVRMPAYIVIVASFVTIVQMLLHAYVTSLYDSLGIYIPLIVVNCIILGRAESYASKNKVLPSVFDGIGMGLGFTIGLTSIGIVRELIGAGTIFGLQVLPKSYEGVSIFILAPGAFLVLAFLCALQNKLGVKGANRHVKEHEACGGDCLNCSLSCNGKQVEKEGVK
ncbi:MAG: RnfABCDGE type electron transport complex subunit E [Eubacterium sp.]|nr:electron transport complex subunit E [Eubacterium sp.]